MSELDQGRLAGRIALVTGASRGLGAAVAKRFGAEGAKLVLLARTVGALEELDDAVRDAGGLPPRLVPHDLRASKAHAAMLHRILFRSALVPIRHAAMATMAVTAGLMPKSTPATAGTVP